MLSQKGDHQEECVNAVGKALKAAMAVLHWSVSHPSEITKRKQPSDPAPDTENGTLNTSSEASKPAIPSKIPADGVEQQSTESDSEGEEAIKDLIKPRLTADFCYGKIEFIMLCVALRRRLMTVSINRSW